MRHTIIEGKRAQGKKEWDMIMDGKKVTRNGAIKAQCYDCMGGYHDGVGDCGCDYCPLYQYHPYKKEA